MGEYTQCQTKNIPLSIISIFESLRLGFVDTETGKWHALRGMCPLSDEGHGLEDPGILCATCSRVRRRRHIPPNMVFVAGVGLEMQAPGHLPMDPPRIWLAQGLADSFPGPQDGPGLSAKVLD